MRVKVLRLTTGEEIIATVKEKDDGYHLENPGFIVPTEKGVGIMDMMPYTKIPEKGVFIPSIHVLFVTEPVGGLEVQYKKLHSKIITQDKSIIM